MKTLLIGAAASALLAPAAAHADTTGFIDLGYEHSEASTGGSADLVHIGAAIQHDFNNNWSIQGDGRTTHVDVGAFTVSSGYTAMHLYTGVSQKADIGAFIGLLDRLGSDAGVVGLEARVHQGQWALQGSVSYTRFDVTVGTSDAWDTRASGHWFINPDTALTPAIAYTEWNDGTLIYKQFGLGLGAAHRFGNGLEIYGDYIHSDNDVTGTGQYEVDTVRVGLRLNLNGGDLQTIVNDGASWRGAAGVYDAFHRW